MIWLAFGLWRAGSKPISAERQVNASSLVSSFMTGLLLTLADQKGRDVLLGFLAGIH